MSVGVKRFKVLVDRLKYDHLWNLSVSTVSLGLIVPELGVKAYPKGTCGKPNLHDSGYKIDIQHLYKNKREYIALAKQTSLLRLSIPPVRQLIIT